MRMIVQARIKSRKTMPIEYLCCSATEFTMLPFFELLVELYKTAPIASLACPFCGYLTKAPSEWMPTNGEFWSLPSDTIDIDEGSVRYE